MKLALALLVLAVSVSGNLYSQTLLKLSDILATLHLDDMLLTGTAPQVGPHFFKYYSDELLPLQFQLWKEHVGKEYESEEEHAHRHKVWSDNVKFIHEHSQNNRSYTVAMNHIGDLTFDEYKKTMLGTKIHKKVPYLLGSGDDGPDNWPFDLDWRTKGYVTPVKNQGQCGSCWSFSTTGAIEGARVAATGKLESLSEQNLVDCSTSYGNQGCNGGLMDQAFQYVIDNGGLDTETAYPYEGVEESCRFNATLATGKITSFKDVPAGSERALKAAVAGSGPVSVAIDAGHRSFQFYSTGVYDEPECSPEQLDHGVLVAGYGVNGYLGAKYWLVKNSWSEAWGQQGYIWMSRGKQNQCGIASAASYPIA